MALKLITPPAVEPVSVEELKSHSRIDADTSQDADLAGFIAAGREDAELRTRRSLVTTTWRLSLDDFPRDRRDIRLPRPPLLSVPTIVYTDENGDQQTLVYDAGDGEGEEAQYDYQVDTDSEPGRIEPLYGESWPATRRQPNAVQITFTAGYGDDPADVPAAVKTAIRMLAAHLYENREATTDTPLTAVPMAVDALLATVNYGSYTE